MITLEKAQANLDALLDAQVNNLLSVTIGGRTTSYRNARDLVENINYWSRIVAGLKREAGGESRHSMSVASFRTKT